VLKKGKEGQCSCRVDVWPHLRINH